MLLFGYNTYEYVWDTREPDCETDWAQYCEHMRHLLAFIFVVPCILISVEFTHQQMHFY